MKYKLDIDTDDIKILEAKGKEFMFDPEADRAIDILLKFRDEVNGALEVIKKKTVEDGKKFMGDNFKAVGGDNASLSYSQSLILVIADSKLAAQPKNKKFVKLALDTKAVREWSENNNGRLPDFVGEKMVERTTLRSLNNGR